MASLSSLQFRTVGSADLVGGNRQSESEAVELIVQSIKKGDNGGILEGVKQFAQCPFVNIRNPVQFLLPLLRALGSNEAEHLDAALKVKVLAAVRDLVHCLYLKCHQEKRGLTPELHDELKELLSQIERKCAPSDLDIYTLEHAIASASAGIGMLLNVKQLVNDHLVDLFTCMITRDAAKAVPFLKSTANVIHDLYQEHWYVKTLYCNLIVDCLIRENGAAPSELFDYLNQFVRKNENTEWEVVVSIVAGLTRLMIALPNSQEKLFFKSDQGRGVSGYLSFNLFRWKNNWRVREKALQCALLLLSNNPCERVKMGIEDLLLERALVETDGRVDRILKDRDHIQKVHYALQQSWTHRPERITAQMEALQQEIVATRQALQSALDHSQGEQALQLQDQAESQKLVLETLQSKTQEMSELGIQMNKLLNVPLLLEGHSRLLQGIASQLSYMDQKIDQLVGEPCEEVLQRIALRIGADIYRQSEQQLYIETDCVPQARLLQQKHQAFSEPLFSADKPSAYSRFLESPSKVLLVAAFAGSGKTMFTQRIEEDLMKKLMEGGLSDSSTRIPLRIELAGLQDPVHNAVKEGLCNKGFSETHIETLKKRKVLLILDGVDEACYQGKRLTNLDHLYHSNRLFQWCDLKVVFGFRIENLETAEDTKRFSPYTDDSLTSQRLDLLQTAFLCPFSSSQIRAYIRKYVSNAPEPWKKAYPEWILNEGQKYLQASMKIPADLTTRPFTLRVLAEVLPGIAAEQGDIDQTSEITKERLYRAFIERWIQREEDKLIGMRLPDEIEDFKAAVWEYCEALAKQMQGEGGAQRVEKVVYEALDRYGRFTRSPEKIQWDPFFSNDPVSRLCRRGAPLKRTGTEYAFIHPEIQTFFEALSWASEDQ